MLKIEHLTKKYKDKVAVSDLSLEVRPGEICGFIGHNGAGKSTTLKCVCGILTFEEGQISIFGHDVRTDSLAAKQITAYLPDNPDLYEFLPAIKYLNLIADIFGVPEDLRNARIARYADMLELTPNLAELISSYSHGMKQKLAIISALLHEPKLFVLDEPFVGLDPKAAFSVKELLRDFTNRGGAVIFSSHVLEVVEKLCDTVAIISRGKLVAFGDTEKVKGDSSLEEVFLEINK
jgi:ABC-2 type transport system ATP-binding protein